ncbi:thioredoxin family protein [Candidatus Roizmanbacteria bacterium]|nr:thioredoxin family protein [Candidatus Roizmanbacteria bacterium]
MALLQSKQLPIGQWNAPDFSLPSTNEKTYTLNEISGKSGTVIFFTCNHCPYAKAAWPILIDLAKLYQGNNISFVAINSNNADTYPEDSFEVMKEKVDEWNIPFPYLRDESQEIARSYQAQCTPDIYVFDKEKKLYYHGRVNDNWQDPQAVKEENLKDALELLVKGEQPPEHQPSSMGCSIKWKEG